MKKDPTNCFNRTDIGSGIITGRLSKHYPFRGHLNKIGLFNGELSSRQCNKGMETHNIFRGCDAMYYRR